MKIRQPWKGFYLNGLTWSPSEIFMCNMMGQTLSEGETLDRGALVTLGFVHSFFLAEWLASCLPGCTLTKDLQGGALG